MTTPLRGEGARPIPHNVAAKEQCAELYGSKDYRYDALDNITLKDGRSYTYGTSKPHAVTQGTEALQNMFFTKSDGAPEPNRDTARANMKDITAHPENWEQTSRATEPVINPANEGGSSTEIEWTNKTTGDKLYEHVLTDKNGNVIDAHYRPYAKQL